MTTMEDNKCATELSIISKVFVTREAVLVYMGATRALMFPELMNWRNAPPMDLTSHESGR